MQQLKRKIEEQMTSFWANHLWINNWWRPLSENINAQLLNYGSYNVRTIKSIANFKANCKVRKVKYLAVTLTRLKHKYSKSKNIHTGEN